MRLERLRIENFGVFQSRLLQFGSQNLVVVYGGNEAGKTTALNGIRQSIFRIRSANALPVRWRDFR